MEFLAWMTFEYSLTLLKIYLNIFDLDSTGYLGFTPMF